MIYSILLTQCYLGDQIQTSEMGGVCSMYEGKQRRVQCFYGET
jgi:hypothetical protein